MTNHNCSTFVVVECMLLSLVVSLVMEIRID